MIQQITDWVTEGVTFGNVAALIVVLIIFRDRLFGGVSLTKLDKEFRDAEDRNDKAHQSMNGKIDTVSNDTHYMRGVLDTIKDRL